MSTDPIADLLVCLKNAQMVKKASVTVPFSQVKDAIVKILLTNKRITSYEVTGKKPHLKLEIKLKYAHSQPAIADFKRISKPGVRIYASVKELNRWLRGRVLTIVSTSKGLLTAFEAKNQKIGGEVICQLK